jgi:two-component system KDP operon response regulator KdpE
MNKHLAIVEDDPGVRAVLEKCLTGDGYQVTALPSGAGIKHVLSKNDIALVIVDIGLPDIDGLTLTRRIREEHDVGIIILSGRRELTDRVVGLEIGADDYITKPFGMDELLARMRAALRHQLQAQGERPIFHSGDLSVDLVRRIVKVADREVKLSPKEYDLLRVLVQHAGKVLTHKFLLGELWDDLTDAQYLRVYVRQLRQKIEADPEQPQYILTETGIGYRLRAPD